MERKRIFISHISKETALAGALKERIVTDFLGLPDVFVSSDRTTIEAGKKWLDEIEIALKAANLVMVMASREAVDSSSGRAYAQRKAFESRRNLKESPSP